MLSAKCFALHCADIDLCKNNDERRFLWIHSLFKPNKNTRRFQGQSMNSVLTSQWTVRGLAANHLGVVKVSGKNGHEVPNLYLYIYIIYSIIQYIYIYIQYILCTLKKTWSLFQVQLCKLLKRHFCRHKHFPNSPHEIGFPRRERCWLEEERWLNVRVSQAFPGWVERDFLCDIPRKKGCFFWEKGFGKPKGMSKEPKSVYSLRSSGVLVA